MRIAVYFRVSTDKQDLVSQEHAFTQWLNEQPTVSGQVTRYLDESISGKTAARPSYQKMLRDSYRNKFDILVVYRLDRISRNAKEAISCLLSFDQLGIQFISLTQPVLNLSFDNPFRRTMLAAFAELAEIERQTTVDRVKSGLAAARRRGVKLGAPLKRNADDQKRVRQLRAQGMSYRQIVRETKISYNMVYNMINGPDL